MTNKVYTWKRFWCTREGRINLLDGGYLYDLDSEWGHIYNPDVVPFDSIANTPCLLLLGEPGIGKSYAMEAERQEINQNIMAQGGQVLWLDLRSYSSEDRLVRDLFGSAIFTSWLAGSYELHIFLDSLDECLLRIETVAALLVDEFKKYPVDRLRLRITCRTADLPSILEEGLRSIWWKDAVEVYELAPLRRVDVRIAAEANGIDSEAFFREVDRKEVVPLAIKPVTLKFLLNTYRRKGGFPSTQKDLYLEGCRLLCEETNDSRMASRRVGDISAEQLLIIAARIAATTIFANRYAIYTGIDYGDAPEEDVSIRELCGGVEVAGGREVDVDRAAIEESLATGLFSGRGSQRIGWAHQTYAEFLAAWYLVEHKLLLDQINSLIIHPGDPEGKLVPQLYEAAAWLASISPDVFRMVMQSDPEVLLRSDVTTADVRDRANLVGSLLKAFDEEKLLDRNLDPRKQYGKLQHPGLADQLKPYITDASKGIVVRRVATDIAEACQLKTLQDDLVKVALNPAEPLPVRINAAYAINRIGDSKVKRELKPLAYGIAGNDPDDELKGVGLAAVWPDHITAEELFNLITPPKHPSLIGAYRMFLSSEIVSHLQPADLPLALRWIEQFGQYSEWHVFDKLKESILIKAWANLNVPDVLESFAKTYLSQLEHHERSLSIDVSHSAKRHMIIEALLPLLVSSENSYVWLVFSEPPLVTSKDVPWMIERLKVATSEQEGRVLAKLIERVFDYRDVDQMGVIINTSQESPILAEAFASLLKPVELNSPQAEQMKARYLEMKQWQSRKKDRPLVEPPPEKRVASLLDQIEAGDSAAWWHLNLEMTLEADSLYYGDELQSDLTALPGWKNADDITKARIIEAAKKYVVEQDPETDRWFGTNVIHRPAFAGYRALRLLLQEAPGFLLTIATDVWRKWAPIILVYPKHNYTKGNEAHMTLIKIAYEHGPDEIIDVLLRMIDKENNDHGFPFILQDIGVCWDEHLAKALLLKLRDEALTPQSISGLIGLLLEHNVDEARLVAESFITLPLSTEEQARAKAKGVATVLLTHAEDAGWPVVWPAMNTDVEFGREVVSSIAHISGGEGNFVQRLTEEQVADLYIWLVRQFPHVEDPNFEGVHTVGVRESIAHWRDGLLVHLKARGTNEACDAIRCIIRELPELEWLKWTLLEAQIIARRQTWIPSEPADVLRIATGQQSHIAKAVQGKLQELPIQARLFIEDIDSFSRVREVSAPEVAHLLQKGGYLNISEEDVQVALEQILNEPYHKKDWGGEYNDLYSANVIINEMRTASAFLLKGNGLKKRVMEIKDCGQNGDQLVRLIESPALLFVVQFVGNISESVIKDIEGKVSELRGRGKPAYFCILNGQDTARLLYAYGKLS
jgi:predicted NACHT family NTPase